MCDEIKMHYWNEDLLCKWAYIGFEQYTGNILGTNWVSERTGRECTRFVCHDSKLNICCPTGPNSVTEGWLFKQGLAVV